LAEIILPILYNILQAMGSKFAARVTYSFHALKRREPPKLAAGPKRWAKGDVCRFAGRRWRRAEAGRRRRCCLRLGPNYSQADEVARPKKMAVTT